MAFLDNLDPATLFFWVGIPSIIMLAAAACGLIVMTTKWAIRSMMATTADALRSVNTVDRVEATPLVTIGFGSVPWRQGGRRVTVVRRSGLSIVGADAAEDTDDWLSALVDRLIEQGVDGRDIEDFEPEVLEQGQVLQKARIVVRNPEQLTSILEAGRAAGFFEDQATAQEEVLPEDALEDAGIRAMRDARKSVFTLAQGLGVSSDNFDVLDAELETLTPPGEAGEVVKRARLRWRAKAA